MSTESGSRKRGMPTTPACGSTHSNVDWLADPLADDVQVLGDRRLDRRQDPLARLEHPGGHLLVDRRAADQDLLLRREQRLRRAPGRG